ncbi:MAG TPA: hypothetical protein VN823_04605 [Stellaceae bacterium]|nr:hypothetical protein [Stellaceae bacterium]
MVHVIDDLGFSVALEENISRTLRSEIQDYPGQVNGCGQTARTRASDACSFVVAEWRTGAEPFCGAPTRPGSSYCARHQPVCIVPRESAEGRLREAALLEEAEAAPEPPPELAHLRESALPEALPDDIGDLRALLDHPPPDPDARDPE